MRWTFSVCWRAVKYGVVGFYPDFCGWFWTASDYWTPAVGNRPPVRINNRKFHWYKLTFKKYFLFFVKGFCVFLVFREKECWIYNIYIIYLNKMWSLENVVARKCEIFRYKICRKYLYIILYTVRFFGFFIQKYLFHFPY